MYFVLFIYFFIIVFFCYCSLAMKTHKQLNDDLFSKSNHEDVLCWDYALKT